MKRFRNILLTVFSCCIVPLYVSALEPLEASSLSDTRMFHIERSLNKNIVCYDFNLINNGTLNSKEPIHVYWINREEHPGQRSEIKYFQQPAFGYKVTNVSNNVILVRLNAVKSRPISIEKDETMRYICKTSINGQTATLQKIYVKTRDTNPLQVEYVEISGIVSKTGAVVTERIRP